MTQARWRNAADMHTLFKLTRANLTRRQLRLFLCSACRLILPTSDNGICRNAVETLEQYAEGRVNLDTVHIAEEPLQDPTHLRNYRRYELIKWLLKRGYLVELIFRGEDLSIQAICEIDTIDKALDYLTLYDDVDAEIRRLAPCLAGVIAILTKRRMADEQHGNPAISSAMRYYPWPDSVVSAARHLEMRGLCSFFREIVRSPCEPLPENPPWLTPEVRKCAKEIDQSRDFLKLQEFGDTLQDAGCEDGDILLHCSRTDPRIRGSWLIDWILGKDGR